MVCENRRLRSLLVSRRGGFLEDPFFRDAWGDYNNAVRRIVDRFNHGMFTPSDRLRDSHYHSIYRTLRSARINYAAQAARFKDEGDHYKLVMDVREFVGGEITVRTAGGTLSVRGRLETGVGEDTGSAHSGMSAAGASTSSARTLHRRFNLPPDADGEKVQSTLSRDAVLTVTIGKRTDVRVIPVTVEGETPPSSASGTSAYGRSGTKRHSATVPEPGPTPSKRSQDSHHENERGSQDVLDRKDRKRSTSRNRGEVFRMGRNGQDEKDNAHDWKTRREEDAAKDSEKMNRRGSEIFTRRDGVRENDDIRRKSYPTNSTRQTAEEISKKYLGRRSQEHESRRRARDTVEEDQEVGQRTRKRASKYEEVKEYHIPIRFEGESDSNIVFQYPAKNKENIVSSGEQGASGGNDGGQQESPKSATYNKDAENIPYSTSVSNRMEREKQSVSTKPEISKALEKDTSNLNNNLMQEKENIKPPKEETPWVYSKLYQTDSPEENSVTEVFTEKKASGPSEEKKRYYFGGLPLSDNKGGNVNIKISSPERKSPPSRIDEAVGQRKTEEESSHKTVKMAEEEVNREVLASATDNTKIQKDYLRTESQESESPGRKSPLEGREVLVEKKQSDMEGDMFKDCWQNFSSTLQEVLSRLQELSSELGPQRPQVSSSKSSKSNKNDEGNMDPTQDTSTDRTTSRIINKVPKGDAENGEISLEGEPASIGGDAWAYSRETKKAAAVKEVERGVGGGGEEGEEETEEEDGEEEDSEEEEGEGGEEKEEGTPSSPTSPPTVYAGLGSVTRSSHHINREIPRHMDNNSSASSTSSAPSSSSSSCFVSTSANTKGDYSKHRSGFSECQRDQSGQYPPKQQVSGQNVVTERETKVPRRRSSAYSDGEGDGGVPHGGARAKGSIIVNTSTTNHTGRPASICDPVRHSVPMSFIHEGSVADSLGKQVSDSHRSDNLLDSSISLVPRPRPTSLNIAHEGSLLKDLRKSSPVNALKDHFLSRATPPSERSSCDTDVHYIPVELEASKRVTLTSNSKSEENPLSPSTSTTSPRTPAATLPLCERRGKGVDNLVIVEDDDRSSNVSSQVSTSGTYDEANTGDIATSESASRQWPGHDKAAAGSSRIRSSSTDYESFQNPSPQHSLSSRGGAESRTPTHIDNIVSIGAKGGSSATKSWRCPRPLSSSLSESEPDVDEIISQAERVIEETKRLSASITNELPIENDLDKEKYGKFTREKARDSLKPSSFNLAPNIDTRTSPESNFVELQDEEDKEEKDEESENDDDEDERERESNKSDSVVEGCLSIPLLGLAGRPQRHPRYTPSIDLKSTTHPPPATSFGESDTLAHPDSKSNNLTIEAVDENDDVTECEEVCPTIVTSPEIQSSDVMGCARERLRREGGGDGGVFVPHNPRDMPPPPHTLSHEAQPTRASRQAAAAAAAAASITARDSSMGGAFSRGRTHDSAGRHPPTSNVSHHSSTGKTKGTPTTPQSPTTPSLRERSISKEEPSLPPYVRQKPEPTKRYSGFGHVQSDNVRKMRDVWGSRQEPTTTTAPSVPTRPSRVAASPPPVPRRRDTQSPRRTAPDSPKRFSDIPKFDPQKYRMESPSRGPESPRRVLPDYTNRRGSDSTRRCTDSPSRGPDSPRRGPDSPRRGPDSPKRSFFSRDSPSRDSGRSAKNSNTNFYSSTISSRNKASSSPRRGSTSSTEGAAATSSSFAQSSVPRSSAAPAGGAESSSSPIHDKYRTGNVGAGGGGGWSGSPATPRRNSRRASTPPPPTPPSSRAAPPPPPSHTTSSAAAPASPASPFHHKVFKRLRDSSLQPDSETICFKEEEDRYKLVMDVEEYVPGEIEVLQDDKKLTVKGRVETKHGSNMTTRTFERNFHIPNNTREEDIDSALSKDGILTVYVPKKRERVIKIELTD